MWEIGSLYLAIFLGSRYILMLTLQKLALKSHDKINPKEIKEPQRHRESMWPLGLLLDGLAFILFTFLGVVTFNDGPYFLALGVMILAHALIVEPIYYVYHRILHVGWFYRVHHLYHHKSVITDPITSMSFTLIERLSYTVLFSIPVGVVYLFGILDFWAIFTFFIGFDVLNSLGHFNVKMETEKYKKSKLLKWLIYSPEYHEKHHSIIETNYALFMPIYDRLFNTVAKD
jgi:sterol desaturase/sphingolipid hydroxylase (fatty acid hydroxylase superfamily)